jgi:hypothetical protein
MDGYWRWCVRDGSDRDFVLDKIEEVRSKGGKWEKEEYKEWIRTQAVEREGTEVDVEARK